jgi:hypothetical protein
VEGRVTALRAAGALLRRAVDRDVPLLPEIARSLSVRELSLSLSHGREHAVAVVVVVRDGSAVAWDAEALG